MVRIENNYDLAFAEGLGDVFLQEENEPVQQQTSEKPAKSTKKTAPRKKKEKKETYVASVDQRRAVEKAQNASRRGRGHKKGKRTPIHFVAEQMLVTQIEEIHFRLGKTKNELYNEALKLLVQRYDVG